MDNRSGQVTSGELCISHKVITHRAKVSSTVRNILFLFLDSQVRSMRLRLGGRFMQAEGDEPSMRILWNLKRDRPTKVVSICRQQIKQRSFGHKESGRCALEE